ncbi:MAG: tryptophanase [Deltaproteobacteria bacterium]|nr:tryptophanase [Deltaproteobacteria bacterium]
MPVLKPFEFDCEPYTIHAIEKVAMKTVEERKKAMEEAGYNTFLLRMEDVTIDLLTDSGTAAMSVEQWKSYLGAIETPNTSDAYVDLVKTAQKVYGYKYIILTHQGRAAEHIMSQMFIKPGDYVPGNMYFTTTKQHQEMAGGIFVDVIVDEAHDTDSTFEWKGNVDIKKLADLYEKARSEGRRLAYISFEFNVNLAGGQPVSMDNMKEVYEFCKPRGIPVFFDATRCAENAIFIKQRDPRYKDASIEDILLEMFSYGDGATISAKKDMLTNLSGALIFRDNEEWYKEALRMLQIFEGSYSSGGTSAGDIATHAQGIREMVDERYLRARVEQARYLGQLLIEAGIPIVMPPGGHAVFIDAKKFLPHLDQDQFPAQTLAAHIFIETGVRAMERGNVSKGRDPITGKNYRPKLELVRLTIPRRVYSLDHMKAVADGIIRLYKKRDTIRGLEFTYEPKALRFFQSRFKLI